MNNVPPFIFVDTFIAIQPSTSALPCLSFGQDVRLDIVRQSKRVKYEYTIHHRRFFGTTWCHGWIYTIFGMAQLVCCTTGSVGHWIRNPLYRKHWPKPGNICLGSMHIPTVYWWWMHLRHHKNTNIHSNVQRGVPPLEVDS